MKRWILISLFFFNMTLTRAAPNVLSNTDHAAPVINTGITTLLGAGVVDVSILTDETSTDNGTNFLTSSQLITAARDTTRTNFQIANNTNTRNDAPYQIITQSTSGYVLSLDEVLYTSLYNSGVTPVLYNMPMVNPTGGISPPPAAMTNIIAPPGTNPNNGHGGGTEFSMSAGYKGFSTATSSDTAASFAGVLASIAHNHPTWNNWDIKASLRQTASKWASGWNADYGNIDYDSATAIGSTASLFLQPPNTVASSPGMNQITFTIYPFRSSRRDHEVLYLVPASYSWPVKNEYVLADITASGAQLLYTGNHTDITPTGTVTFSATPGRYNLVAFTADNLGAYSRHELWSDIAVSGNCF